MGRFPTCSSPVRHGCPRRDPVRLACIRHAASVNPEPGSNSPPKYCACPVRKPAQDFVSSLRASHLDAPGRRLRRPVLPPVPGSDCRTRRSSIFGRPVDVTGPTPRFSGASSRASSGNQPVKVLAFSFHAKTHPSSEGRLIYHVSKMDVKARLRGLPIPRNGLGSTRNGRRLDARRARTEFYHRSPGNASYRLPVCPFRFPRESCSRRPRNCRPNRHPPAPCRSRP